MELGVVGDGQRVFELSYPLTHMGDLTMKLLRVGENEPGTIEENRDVCEKSGCSPRAMTSTQGTYTPIVRSPPTSAPF